MVYTTIGKLFQPLYFYLQETQQVSDHLIILLKSIQIALQITLLYFLQVASLTRYGGSPGKLLLDLRVISSDTGKKLTTTRALVRETIGKLAGIATLGVGFLLIVKRSDCRALHDLMSGSVVKRNTAK